MLAGGVGLALIALATGCAGAGDAQRSEATTRAEREPPCRPSPTTPFPPQPDGPVISRGGRSPVTNGPFEGRTARLAIVNRIDGLYAAKLWHEIDVDGPSVVRVTAVRLDGTDRATFSLNGVAPRRRTLTLRAADLLVSQSTGKAFAPGGMYVSSPGCYRLRARWAGGGYSMIVRVFVEAARRER